MKKYMKPMFFATEFDLNETIAGCQKQQVGTEITTTYPPQTVICEIGAQEEHIFTTGTTGCNTAATQYAFGTYNNVYYFCWKASIGDTSARPTEAQKKLMASVTGVSDPQGWHYCEVASLQNETAILGFSY